MRSTDGVLGRRTAAARRSAERRRCRVCRHRRAAVTLACSDGRPDHSTIVTDSQLAVLLRQTQWTLDEAAHDFPAAATRRTRRDSGDAGGHRPCLGAGRCAVSASLPDGHPSSTGGQPRADRRAHLGDLRRCLRRAQPLLLPPGAQLTETIVLDIGDRYRFLQSPAAAPPPSLPGGFSQAGRPVLDHGGAGEPTPTRPRSRRAPLDDPSPPHSDGALLLTGGAPCPA